MPSCAPPPPPFRGLQYTAGTCSVQSVLAPGLLVCSQVPVLLLPAANPVWTCGIASQGNFTCSTGGRAWGLPGRPCSACAVHIYTHIQPHLALPVEKVPRRGVPA